MRKMESPPSGVLRDGEAAREEEEREV